MEKVELLAPVGSMEALIAAVENGADAVYLGGKLFNARQYASNFDNDELKKAVEYAHIRGVKVYVTVNILLDDKELQDIIDYIIYLYNIDVDALIIQDLGLARLIKNILPDFEIHGSTQMTVNNHMGVKFLEDLGFQRVVLARELSVDEIMYIKNKTNAELEGFIHGALCVCYSGQCLMSSLIGGRSGNRGRCAQPCRMIYTLIDINTNKVVKRDLKEKYILSPKDLNTIENLEDIIQAGITSLKIEGRMKRPEYVSIIVSNYKKVLDKIKNYQKNNSITEKDKKDILQIFNRGFTKGYILGDYGKSLMSIDRPDNRGIYLGDVVKIDNRHIYIKLIDSLSKGDGIEFEREKGDNVGIIVDKLFVNGNEVIKAHKGSIVSVKKTNNITLNTKVYKTLDTELIKRSRLSFTDKAKLKRIGIYMAIDLKINKPIELHLWDDDGNYVTVKSQELVEEAIKVSLTEDKVREHMGKLGDTPYYLKSIQINLMENSTVPIRILNNIRRKGIEELNKKRGNLNNRVEIIVDDIVKKAYETLNFPGNYNKVRNKLSVKVNSIEQFKKIDLNKLDRVYLNFKEDLGDCIKEIKNSNKEVFISTGKILYNEDFSRLDKLLSEVDITNIEGISVSNIGTFKFIKDRYKTNIHCDVGLNIFNSSTVKLLEEEGAKSVTLSPELRLNQISHICSKSNISCETIVYGYLPVMVMKYCPMSLVKDCNDDKKCNECNLIKGYGLVDRKGMVFQFTREDRTTTVYNSQPLIVLEHLNTIYNTGVDMIRLDFTNEREDIRSIQDIYYGFVHDNIDSKEVEKFVDYYRKKGGFTKGHYFRGVD